MAPYVASGGLRKTNKHLNRTVPHSVTKEQINLGPNSLLLDMRIWKSDHFFCEGWDTPLYKHPPHEVISHTNMTVMYRGLSFPMDRWHLTSPVTWVKMLECLFIFYIPQCMLWNAAIYSRLAVGYFRCGALVHVITSQLVHGSWKIQVPTQNSSGNI